MNLVLNLFEWEGLPDTCDERVFELALINSGKAALVNDRGTWYSLPCSPGDNINIYGYPTKVFAYGLNGYNKQFENFIWGGYNKNANGYVCYDNKMRYAPINYIFEATSRVTSALRSIDVAAQKLKNPYFIVCEESQLQSVKKMMEDIDANVSFIVSSKAFSADSFKVLPTNQDTHVIEALWLHYFNLDNMIRTMFGINNNPAPMKAERLIVDEVNSNNQITQINIQTRLQERQNFCEMINENTDLNISVKIRNEGMYENTDESFGESSERLAMEQSDRESTN